jgi:hypothetical protein
MEHPRWNFEQAPCADPQDETAINLRAYFDRVDDDHLRAYRPEWTDEQVMTWDGNFTSEGALLLPCSERDVDVAEFRRVLEQCLAYRASNGWEGVAGNDDSD